jgi:predicted metalloprotease
MAPCAFVSWNVRVRGVRKHPTLEGRRAYRAFSTKQGGSKLRSHEIIIIVIIIIIIIII